MMALRTPPCLECGSRALKNSSWCEFHKPEAFRKNFRKDRLPKNWGSLRARVLKRDLFVCYLCGGEGADSVDHVINDDNDDLSNLKAVHQNVTPFCHREKTAKEAFHAKMDNRPAQRSYSMVERARKKGII